MFTAAIQPTCIPELQQPSTIHSCTNSRDKKAKLSDESFSDSDNNNQDKDSSEEEEEEEIKVGEKRERTAKDALDDDSMLFSFYFMTF
jgi:hypothetical protein